MGASLFAVVAGTLPVALFCTAPVLLLARLRKEPWRWRKAALVAALVSALVATVAFGIVASVFADGLRVVDGLAAAAGGSLQAALCTGIVAGGARLLDRLG